LRLCVEPEQTVFESQMLTYLRLSGLKPGLVINSGERILKTGIHRDVNDLPEDMDFNAKTQRRKDATAAGDAAPRPIHEVVWKLGWRAWRQRMA